jgi:microcystin-dependent protein
MAAQQIEGLAEVQPGVTYSPQDFKRLQEAMRRVLKQVTNAIQALQATVNSAPTPTPVAGALTGEIKAWPASVVPAGYLPLAGQLVSRATFAALWTLISKPANGFALVADAAWLAGASASFSSGDGATTFRLPDAQAMYLRGTGSNTVQKTANGTFFAGPALGGVQGDQFQGHEHQYSLAAEANVGAGSGIPASGPISYSTQNTSVPVSDGTNGTPRVGAETRPASFGVNFIIKT